MYVKVAQMSIAVHSGKVKRSTGRAIASNESAQNVAWQKITCLMLAVIYCLEILINGKVYV